MLRPQALPLCNAMTCQTETESVGDVLEGWLQPPVFGSCECLMNAIAFCAAMPMLLSAVSP